MILKKFLYSVLLFFVFFSLNACREKESVMHDGTFTGVGVGRNDEIKVSITITDGMITDAKIISDKESPEISGKAKEHILRRFIEDGETGNIDIVSGATITSDGLLDALDAAVAQAKGTKIPQPKLNDVDCDIAIIGAGGAGLTAATEAASKGAKVIVFEKLSIVGGNSNFSTGGINAAYTKEQQRLGIKDSTEVFFNDTMIGGKYLNDPDLVHTLVNQSASIVEWLQSPLIGADLSDVGMFGGATNKRIHRPKGGGAIGEHLVPLLKKAALAQGAEIRLKHKVVDITSDEGKASGLRISTGEGEYNVNANAVIIASGGFGANPDLITTYQPTLAKFATTKHPGATDDAFSMVEKFNAALVQMEQIQTHPIVVVHTGIMITEAVRGNGAILVNHLGKRFVNEMETRDIVSNAILKSDGHTAFIIFNQNIRESLKAIEEYTTVMISAQTISELAKKIEVNPTILEDTIKKYNAYVVKKIDPDFKRNPASMEKSLAEGPYYAIEIEPAVHHTMGGLKINTKAEVINKSGKPIPGLFAAGEVTGGVHGANRLGGNAVADYCIFGKIAADSAIEYVKSAQ